MAKIGAPQCYWTASLAQLPRVDLWVRVEALCAVFPMTDIFSEHEWPPTKQSSLGRFSVFLFL